MASVRRQLGRGLSVEHLNWIEALVEQSDFKQMKQAATQMGLRYARLLRRVNRMRQSRGLPPLRNPRAWTKKELGVVKECVAQKRLPTHAERAKIRTRSDAAVTAMMVRLRSSFEISDHPVTISAQQSDGPLAERTPLRSEKELDSDP